MQLNQFAKTQMNKLLKTNNKSWANINVQKFSFRYVGLILFFALGNLNDIQESWKMKTIFIVQVPPNSMPRDSHHMRICNNHMSDPKKDVEKEGDTRS